MADPILKWAGGKRQLLGEIYKRFPKNYKRYHEPFIGGGALLFDLEPEEATMNDMNPRLVNFYQQVKNNPDKIIAISKSFRTPKSKPDLSRPFSSLNRNGNEIKNYYYQQRELFNNRPYDDNFDPVEEAALLLYLNRTGYNGLYRENSRGGFNVPIGSYKNPDWIREKEILKTSELLQNVDIFCGGFEYILNIAESGDLVYFDPPYEPMSSTASFNDYSSDGFDIEDQKRLLNVAQELDTMGVYIIMSNSAIMYQLYEECGFIVDLVGARRAINSDATKRGEVNEILATNVKYT